MQEDWRSHNDELIAPIAPCKRPAIPCIQLTLHLSRYHLEMKKYLLTCIRILIAAGGIGFIVFSLTWTDHVQLPAGTKMPDGSLLLKATSYPTIAGDEKSFNRGELVTIRIDDQLRMNIPTDDRGTEDNQFQFKPGITPTLREAKTSLLVAGWLSMGLIFPLQTTRWLLLLRARKMPVSFSKAFRLYMVGNFFNYCMPGSTGGDVVKAYYAAKGSGRNADAVMSVVMDRIAGVVGLIMVGGIAGLFMLDNLMARRITGIIWLLAAMTFIGGVIFLSPMLRRILGIDYLISKLPGQKFFQSLNQAAMAYRDHKTTIVATIALSVIVHCCLITSTTLAGYALGITQPANLMAVVVPVLLFGAAIPISYQGLGIQEAIGIPLLVTAPLCTSNQLIGMLMLYRLYMVAYSMTGSLFLLRGDIHMHPQNNGEMTATSPME